VSLQIASTTVLSNMIATINRSIRDRQPTSGRGIESRKTIFNQQTVPVPWWRQWRPTGHVNVRDISLSLLSCHIYRKNVAWYLPTTVTRHT